jgi:hypothetical protein
VLMVALMAIALMTVQGTIATSNVLNNIATTTKNSLTQDATSFSDAAMAEVKLRLKGVTSSNTNFRGDPNATSNYMISNPTVNWSAYLTSIPWQSSKDPEYSSTFTNYFPTSASLTNTTITVNSVQQTLPYWIKMRHKREYDAEQYGHRTTSPHYTDNDGSTALHTTSSRGNVIWYGYLSPTSSLPVQFTTSFSGMNYAQVDIATIYSESNGTTQKVQVEVARDVGPPFPGAMYSRGNVNFMVTGAIVSGGDNCAVASRSPLYVRSPATISGTATYSGSPSTTTTGTIDIDIAGFIQKYKDGATVVTADQSGGGYGTSTNYVTVYSNTSLPYNANGLSLTNLTGYGLLLVEGDLTVDKDFTWYGPILVTGTLTFNTSATKAADDVTVRGGILAGNIVGVKQEFDVRYDSCQIARAMGTKPAKLLRWRKL